MQDQPKHNVRKRSLKEIDYTDYIDFKKQEKMNSMSVVCNCTSEDECKQFSIGNGMCVIFQGDARELDNFVDPVSVSLVVTSPPYPMIKMWDDTFSTMNPQIRPLLDNASIESAWLAFEKMHCELDKVWKALFAVCSSGCIVAINIGDATRSFEKNFQLFPNAARCTMSMLKAGFSPLPNIYWKKPTNSPNAFLGSGFLPPNAYVTLDCEHILIFRKGPKREFKSYNEKIHRQNSKYEKIERDLWFSQTWDDIKGVRQKLISGRRSGSFPIEIPRRLIQMFSVRGDNVLDPFIGTGTTAIAAMECDRKCIGIELDGNFVRVANDLVSISSEQTKVPENCILSSVEKKDFFCEES